MATTITQISIFLENKIGSLNETMELISRAEIRIIAATVSDTSEYGILRLITTDNARAMELLRSERKNCAQSEVIALSCEATAASFYDRLKVLSADGVVIDYMYCFSIKERSFIILRVSDNDKAMVSIMRNGLKSLSESELTNL
ncbi:MAG: acetolactate synthase [Rikenellaceae bacterium]